MREYLTSILLVSAVTAVLSALPSEERVRRSVSFAMAVAVLAVTVLPLPSLLSGLRGGYSSVLDRLEEESLLGSEWLEEETLASVSDGLRDHLADRYRISADDIEVEAFGDLLDGTVILHTVKVTLSGGAQMADVIGMVKYIEENTGAECEVIYLEK